MEKILSLQATKYCRYKQPERKFCPVSEPEGFKQI